MTPNQATMNTPPREIHVRSEQQTDVSAVRRVHLLAFPTEMEANLVDNLRGAGKTVVAPRRRGSARRRTGAHCVHTGPDR